MSSASEYFKYNSVLFAIAFGITLAVSYAEGFVLKIRKPTWAHVKNAFTAAVVAIVCVQLYKTNDQLEIFRGDMPV